MNKFYIPRQETTTITYWTEECIVCGNQQELKSEMKSIIEFNDRNYQNEKVFGLDHTNIKFIEPYNVCEKCGNKFENN